MRRLSQRQWRAAGVSALALLGIAVAAFAYLRPTSTTHSTAALKPPGESPKPLGNILSYDFVTPSTGWAIAGTESPTSLAGPLSLFKTVDGAKHWQRQLSVQSEAVAESLASFSMMDATNGFLVAGDPLRLYRTRDGTHWTTAVLPTQDVIQVTFSDVDNGWALAASPPSYSGPHFYSTTDGGASWTRLPDPPVDAIVFEFRGPSEGWIGAKGAGQPHVYISADRGHSWTKRALPTPPGFLGKDLYGSYPHLLPDVGVVAWMNDKKANYTLTSFDLGATWTYTAPPSGVVSQQMNPRYAYLDAYHWWATEGTALYKSSNAGLSWTQISGSLPYEISLRVFDARVAVAWAGRSSSALLLTTDGGLHWTSLKVPTANTA
jgi:photosystem II stability/assembly factor-like uncharacterized protein